MATFFGEVLPVVSRAVDEDDEDDELHEQSVPYRWRTICKEHPKANKNIADIFISFGKAALGFSQAYLLNENDTEILALVSPEGIEKQVIQFSTSSFSDKACYVLSMKSKPNSLFVQCNSDVKPDQYFAWTDLVLSEVWKLFPDNLRKRVTVFCSLNSCDYKSETPNDELNIPFLRMLKTEGCDVKPCCPYLETPNVVAGLPSQVLSYCQIHNIDSCLYVCYVENSLSVDSTCMKAFKPVLKNPCYQGLKINPDGDKKVLLLAKQIAHHTTLYI